MRLIHVGDTTETEQTLSEYKCQKCEFKALNNVFLRRHMQLKHAGEESNENITKEPEFNCKGCDFQGTSEEHLKKHFSLKHTIPCRNCKEEFQEKTKLMIHRKNKHPNTVAPCRKFAKGDCNFTRQGRNRITRSGSGL